jgi:hypothetical protein
MTQQRRHIARELMELLDGPNNAGESLEAGS